MSQLLITLKFSVRFVRFRTFRFMYFPQNDMENCPSKTWKIAVHAYCTWHFVYNNDLSISCLILVSFLLNVTLKWSWSNISAVSNLKKRKRDATIIQYWLFDLPFRNWLWNEQVNSCNLPARSQWFYGMNAKWQREVKFVTILRYGNECGETKWMLLRLKYIRKIASNLK